eukprot:scaffold5463_cov82-Phaeocystis_antarctica.AAC.1
MSLSHPLPRKLHPTVGHPGNSTSHCAPGLPSSTRHGTHHCGLQAAKKSSLPLRPRSIRVRMVLEAI